MWAGRDKENQFPSLSDGGGPRAPIAVWEENKPRGLEVTVPLVLLSGCSYMMGGGWEGEGWGRERGEVGVTGGRRSRKRRKRKEGRRTLKATERGRELKRETVDGGRREGETERWRGPGRDVAVSEPRRQLQHLRLKLRRISGADLIGGGGEK